MTHYGQLCICWSTANDVTLDSRCTSHLHGTRSSPLVASIKACPLWLHQACFCHTKHRGAKEHCNLHMTVDGTLYKQP